MKGKGTAIRDVGTGTDAPVAGGAPGRWTEAQWRGITTTGHSLLVSAAAGSGKTAVLAERCAYLVCDAPEPCDVDELLVVTFTEAAAAEMKSRIGAALRSRAAAAPSERLSQQLALLDRANVSTLHGFCSRLLRQHFHLVGLDPSFSVMDGDEAKLLRADVARQLFEDRYELDNSGQFQRLVDAYADGDDERLVRKAIHTHEMLCSLVDGDGWVERSLRRVSEAAAGGKLSDSEPGRELTEFLSTGLAGLRARCDEAVRQVERLGGFSKYVQVLRDHAVTLAQWDQRLRDGGIDALAAEVATSAAGKLPPVKNDVPGKDLAKAAVDAVREGMKSGPWRDCLRFSTAEWRDGLRRVLPHAEVFLGLVKQFDVRYRMAKEAARAIDFSDLERFALRALRDPNQPTTLAPSAAARAYHRRFRHVLVDEYQDINEVQDAILCLLSRECVRGEPGSDTNLFCVGDVKQSIYRFRLAEPARFLDRQRHFRSGPGWLGEVIDLQANFRSRGPLLEAVNGVFERLMTADAVDLTYDQSHRLQPGKDFPTAPDANRCFAGAPIELHLLPDRIDSTSDEEGKAPCDDGDEVDLDRAEREALLVARRVREMLALDGGSPMCVMETGPDGSTKTRPMRFGDVVVLLRSMKHKADEYAEVLEAAGIPVRSDSSTGYFETTEVLDVLALLSVLDNQRQDVPLAALLRSPLASLPDPEDSFARVRVAYPDARQVPFHEAVRLYARQRDDALAAWLRAFLDRLARWRELAQRRPLSDLVWTIYQETGYLAYVGGLRNGRQRVANLLYLHERATQFSNFHRQGLSRFLRFLDSLREESDLGQPQVATEAEDVVRVMSVHRSKGLEFPVVILPDLGKAINLQDCAGNILADRKAGLGMVVVDEEKRVRYPSLASVLVQNRLRQQALAEEMRILYVAMTRAKEHLVLIGTCKPEAPARWAARWTGHEGPLPADVVLGARAVLDWVGPVAAATAPPRGEIFRVTSYAAEDVLAWHHPSRRAAPWTDAQQRMARLEPLDPPPPPHPVADEVVRRLAGTYPFRAYTAVAAAVSVTSVTGATTLRPPPLLPEARQPTGDEVGAATHRVLQHLDFTRPCDAADIGAQVSELVERRLMDSRAAGLVDAGTIEWLVATEVGALLRTHAKRLRRELPIYADVPPHAPGLPPSADPLDRVMLRGRIDVLVPTGDGCVVIDYKTDSVAADRVSERLAIYRPQLDAYSGAVARMTGRPVRTLVVFFTPRTVVELTT